MDLCSLNGHYTPASSLPNFPLFLFPLSIRLSFLTKTSPNLYYSPTVRVCTVTSKHVRLGRTKPPYIK